MHHDIHRRRDLTPDRRKRQICRHQRHRFPACEHVFYTVRMTAGKAAVMARVETLQKVQRLFPTHLANDNPVRPHAERRPDQLPDPDGPGSFRIRVPRL